MMARVPGTQDPSDLFQNGCIGLILALKKFEPERGFAFSTYAVPYILGEMRKPLRSGGAVHLSRSLIQQLQQLTHFREELRAEKGQEASLTEVSQKAGMSPEEAAHALYLTVPEEFQGYLWGKSEE